MKRPSNEARAAMTAIEVLAATVLASLMLASVVGVLAGLSRQQKVVLAQDSQPVWHRQLAAQLEWDLKNSRWMTVSAAGVRLDGFAARDFVTGRQTGRPATIQYYIDGSGPRPLLFRRESQKSELGVENSRVELVCADVVRLVMGGGVIQASTQAMLPQAEAVPVPPQIAVGIYGTSDAKPLFSRQIAVR